MKPYNHLYLVLALLNSCVTYPSVYNTDDLQDRDCYQSYGGQWGYCDVTL